MDALAGERHQVQRQRGGERFTFAGLHLGDGAVVKCRAAKDLHVEVSHLQGPAARLADEGISLGQNSIQRFAAFGSIAQR